MQAQDSTDPTGVIDVDGGAGGSHLARARDRKASAALELRRRGVEWDEIAEVLGYPTARTALVATERALEKQLGTEESQKFLRGLARSRLDRVLRAVYPKAIDETSPEQMLAAAKVRDLIATQMKLDGLEAPTQIVHHSPHQAEIEAWVSDMVKHKTPELEEADIFDGDIIEGEGEWVDDAVRAE
jgi:hypothetical protein